MWGFSCKHGGLRWQPSLEQNLCFLYYILGVPFRYYDLYFCARILIDSTHRTFKKQRNSVWAPFLVSMIKLFLYSSPRIPSAVVEIVLWHHSAGHTATNMSEVPRRQKSISSISSGNFLELIVLLCSRWATEKSPCYEVSGRTAKKYI